MKEARKKNPMRTLLLISLATASTLAFQNCGQFKTQDLESLGSEAASNTPPAANQPDQPGTPSQPGTPEQPGQPIPNPPAIPDYNSDVLSRIGLKIGARGNSTCQLQPPTIPAFDQANDGTNIFKVCQSAQCPYQTISAAVAAAPAGATIAVKAGTYNECVVIKKDNITLQGRGGRPLIQASDCPVAAWNKAIIGVLANNTSIENFELTDPTGDSAVGIGMGKSDANIKVHNVYIHHARGGLLTVLAGDIVVTNSYFDHLGHMEGTDLHTTAALNIALSSKSAVIRNITITHPKQQGGMLGLSGFKNTLDCAILADLEDGLSQYMVSASYGYDVTVTNTVLQRGSASIPQMLLYWERSTVDVPDQFTAKNNIFISDRPTRDREMMVVTGPVGPTTFSNNAFIGPNSSKFSNFPGSQAFESRAAAGLASDQLPYPGAALTPP